MLRNTNMALAFVNATVKSAKKEGLDVDKGKGNWIARRVAINADKPRFAVVQEGRKVIR